MRLTTREKAKLFDELRSMARYEPPSTISNGWHIICVDTSGKVTPENFTTALKAMIREQS